MDITDEDLARAARAIAIGLLVQSIGRPPIRIAGILAVCFAVILLV